MSETVGPFPPFACIGEFLSEEEHVALLRWTLANRDRFQPATVARQDELVVDPRTRVALTARDLGSELEWLEPRFRGALDDLLAKIRITIPKVEFLEMELAAHGHGAHFAPHLDIPIGPGRKPLGGRAGREHDRLLSVVYYFHAQPKRFEGGNLRLYRFGYQPNPTGNDPDTFFEIEPAQNTLVAFPSWVTHEVLEVRCPSEAFPDYRFAVNCWYCAQLKADSDA